MHDTVVRNKMTILKLPLKYYFSQVMLGWVLAYSKDNKKAAEEVLRVAIADTPRGRLAMDSL